MNKYSFWKGVGKIIKYVILFGLPVLVNNFVIAYPEWAQLSVGGLLVFLVNWLKVWAGYRFL